MRLVAIAAAVSLLAGIARADKPKSVVERDVVDVAPAKGVEIDAVHIDNRLGKVTVKGHDSAGVSIVAVKRAPDDETMDRLKISLVPDPAGPVHINTSLIVVDEGRPVKAGSIRIDLVVYIPRKARIDATTWNDDVTLADLDNGGGVTTNEGDIAVSNCAGEIETHAAQGAQRFSEVFGKLDAEGISGEMDIETVKGDRLGARMHDGTIAARKVRSREVELRTTSGDIDFDGEAVAGGTVYIASYSGDVRMTFRAGSSVRVEALSKRGTIAAVGIETTRKGRRVIGTYGGGRNPAGVKMMTNLGNIDLNVRVGLVDDTAEF